MLSDLAKCMLIMCSYNFPMMCPLHKTCTKTILFLINNSFPTTILEQYIVIIMWLLNLQWFCWCWNFHSWLRIRAISSMCRHSTLCHNSFCLGSLSHRRLLFVQILIFLPWQGNIKKLVSKSVPSKTMLLTSVKKTRAQHKHTGNAMAYKDMDVSSAIVGGCWSLDSRLS